MHVSTKRTCLAGLAAAIVLVIIGVLLPDWLLFTMTKAIGYGLVALGIITLMRGGLVSFGQGLVYCIGAYASGLMATRAGITSRTSRSTSPASSSRSPRRRPAGSITTRWRA
mgnify:CR=1 FL=1